MSQRFTSGFHPAIHGPHSLFLIQGISAQREVVAFSTPEAAWHSACHGYRTVVPFALSLLNAVVPAMGTQMFHDDNRATICVILSGRIPTVRHIGRVRVATRTIRTTF